MVGVTDGGWMVTDGGARVSNGGRRIIDADGDHVFSLKEKIPCTKKCPISMYHFYV